MEDIINRALDIGIVNARELKKATLETILNNYGKMKSKIQAKEKEKENKIIKSNTILCQKYTPKRK